MSSSSARPTEQPEDAPRPIVKSAIRGFAAEVGLTTVARSSFDVKLLFLQRFARMLAYGACALVLALFLSELGVSDSRIGLFMTLTLLGDVCMSLMLTLFADAIGRKNILVIGSGLMMISGAVFSISDNYWILVIASIFGVISPSGFEVGPFRAIEESTLAQLSPHNGRTDIFGWYVAAGGVGLALGQITCGFVVDSLSKKPDWSLAQAYRIAFVAYAALGCVKMILALCLSKACERSQDIAKPDPASPSDEPSETDPLLETGHTYSPTSSPPSSPSNTDLTTSKPHLSLLPKISPESRKIFLKLALLFISDSFASGLVTTSWLSYFFHQKYALSTNYLGTIFFATALVAAVSNLVAASIARRIGLVYTMVLTHLPSSVFLALIPVPGKEHMLLAVACLVLRACTSNMDTGPRSAFTASAVLEAERTTVMGSLNVIRTLGQSGAPYVTGWLAQVGKFWVVFVLAGAIKVTYDVAVLATFGRFKGREEKRNPN